MHTLFSSQKRIDPDDLEKAQEEEKGFEMVTISNLWLPITRILRYAFCETAWIYGTPRVIMAETVKL